MKRSALKNILTAASLFGLIFLTAPCVYAENSSASYSLKAGQFSNAGAVSQTSSYKVVTATGIPFAFNMQGQSYNINAGFLYALIKDPDTTPPTGTIKINNDRQYTNSTSVTLNLSAQDNSGGSGVDKMWFSNDNINWSAAEAYAATKTWTLTDGDGQKTVYAKFSDKAGNWSNAVSDTIILSTVTMPMTVRITCDDQYFLYINGGEIGNNNDWYHAEIYNCEIYSGENIIAIKGVDEGGVAALLADFQFDGKTFFTKAGSWKYSLSYIDGWDALDFDDSSWASVTEYGTLGAAPWSSFGSIPELSGTRARWIWSNDYSNHNLVYFRYKFNTNNSKPVLLPIGDKEIEELTQLEFYISASDPDGDYLEYSASGLPQGAAFDSQTHKFSWKPTHSQIGNHNVHFEVKDDFSNIASEDITITVKPDLDNRPPVLEPIGDKVVEAASLLEFAIAATDEDADILTYTASNLPQGASFNSQTHIFRWIPSPQQIGTVNGIHFEVTDGKATDAEDISITVIQATKPIVTVRISCDDSYTLYVNGIRIGSDKNWPDAETYYYQIQDGENVIAIEGIDEGGAAGFIADFFVNGGTVITDSNWKYSTIFQDGWNNVGFDDVSWLQGCTYGDHGVSPWGNISGLNGTYAKWIWSSDRERDDKVYFRRKFNSDNLPPVLAAIEDKTVKTGTLLEFDVVASDPNNDPLSYYAVNIPEGASFEPANRQFSWRPSYSQLGAYQDIYFYVTDGTFLVRQGIKIDVIAGLNITDVSIEPAYFNPDRQEAVAISYILDKDANVTIKIYDLQNNLKRTLLDGIVQTVGSHTQAWDGRDDAGNIVLSGGYTFIIEAIGSEGGNGYFIPQPGGALNAVSLTGLALTDYANVYNNQPCLINYNLAQNAYVSIMVGENVSVDGANWFVVNWQLRHKGQNIDYWDGRDQNGNIVGFTNIILAYWTMSLPENTILIITDKPAVPIIASDPYMILPCYGEISTVQYTLYQSCNISISICSSDGATTIKTLLDNVEKTTGTHTIVWDGKDENGKVFPGEANLTIKLTVNPQNPDNQTVLGTITVY